MSAPARAPAPSEEPRPVLFLSHAGADTEAARSLAARIEANPEARAAGLRVWFDKIDLEPGLVWQQQLERVISDGSTAFAVYVGASGIDRWVESEVRLALSRARRDRGYRFVPVLSATCSGSGALPGFVSLYHAVRDVENDADEFAKLIRAVLHREPRQPVQLVEEPFPGLVSFDESNSHLFFGREWETGELVAHLRRNPLLMVVGDSGAGKSSLVKAGLVPAYRRGALAGEQGDRPDPNRWHVVATRPGSRPFTALADAVAEAAGKMGVGPKDRSEIADLVRSREPGRSGMRCAPGLPPGHGSCSSSTSSRSC